MHLFQALKLISTVLNLQLALRAMPKGQDGDLTKLYYMTHNTPSRSRILFNKLSMITQTQKMTSYLTVSNVI